MKESAVRRVVLSLPPEVLFNGDSSEWKYFVQGWNHRVNSGPCQPAPEGRSIVPQATQDQRVSWERGWMAADAMLAALVTEPASEATDRRLLRQLYQRYLAEYGEGYDRITFLQYIAVILFSDEEQNEAIKSLRAAARNMAGVVHPGRT